MRETTVSLLLAGALTLLVAARIVSSSSSPLTGGAGYAASFSSTRTDVAGFRMPDDRSFDNVTVQAWIKVGSPFQDHAIASYQSYDYSSTPAFENDNELLLWLNRSPNQIEFSVANNKYICKEPACQLFSTTERSNWTHVAVIWQRYGSGSSRTATFVINGEVAQVVTNINAPDRAIRGGGCFILGQDNDLNCGGFNINQAFDGVLDEFQLWSKARTPSEIKATYRTVGVLPGSSRNPYLFAYFSFDDDSSDIIDPSLHARLGRMPLNRNEMVFSIPPKIFLPSTPILTISGAQASGSGLSLHEIEAVHGSPISPTSICFEAAHANGSSVPSGTKVNITGDTSFGAAGIIELAAGAGAMPRYSIIAVNSEGKACVSFQANSASVGTSLSTTYEVSVPGSAAISNGVLKISVSTFQPANVSLETVEDVAKELTVLGGKEGRALDTASNVNILTLPSNGTLFYFSSSASIESVTNIQFELLPNMPVATSEKISAPGLISAAGGILFYKGKQNFYGSDRFE